MSIEALAKDAAPFALRLTKPFRNTLIRVGTLIEGPCGWGEFAPFPEYDDEISGRWLAGALEAACTEWQTPLRASVPVNAIVPALDPDATAELVRRALAQGVTTIKIKVAQPGQAFQEDIDRVKSVRRELDQAGVIGLIRLDANQAWGLDDALAIIPQLQKAAGEIDYVEQPCASLADNASLRELLKVRIAIDEGVRMASRLDQIDEQIIRDSADVLILKAIPLGGVTRALSIAQQVDLPVVVSGSLDTSVGLASGLALAGAVPNLYGACGLGTGALFAQDVVESTVEPESGSLDVVRHEPNEELLAQAGAWVTREEAEWWRERIVRAWHASAVDLVSDEIREVVEQW